MQPVTIVLSFVLILLSREPVTRLSAKSWIWTNGVFLSDA